MDQKQEIIFALIKLTQQDKIKWTAANADKYITTYKNAGFSLNNEINKAKERRLYLCSVGEKSTLLIYATDYDIVNDLLEAVKYKIENHTKSLIESYTNEIHTMLMEGVNET